MSEDQSREELDRMTVLQEAPEADLSAREYIAEDAIVPQKNNIIFTSLVDAKNKESDEEEVIILDTESENKEHKEIKDDEQNQSLQVDSQNELSGTSVSNESAISQDTLSENTSGFDETDVAQNINGAVLDN